MEKRVILITQNVEDIPFDMKDYFHIVYRRDNIFKLQQDLLHRIEFFINFKNVHYVSVMPNVLINGIELTESETNIEVKIKPETGYDRLDYDKLIIKKYIGIMDFAIYNPSDRFVVKSPSLYKELDIQLAFDREMPFSDMAIKDFLISNNRRIYTLSFDQLFPKRWNGKKYPIEISPTQFEN